MRSPQTTSFRDRFTRLRSAQKRRTGVPLYTLAINRPVGRVIAAASPPGVTPNHLTLVGAAFTFAAILSLMIWFDEGLVGILIGLGLVVGFLFDSADGQLARLRNAGSASGEWLDHVIDGIRIVLMHVATLAFLLRVGVDARLAFAACATFAVAASATFFAGGLFEKLTTTAPQTVADRGSRARSILMLPVDYGAICWMYVLLPLTEVFVVVYVLAALAKVVSASALLTKWYRTLARDDAARRASTA